MSEVKMALENVSLLHGEITALRSELNRFRNEVTMNRTNSMFNEFRNQCAATLINGSLDSALNLSGKEGKSCSMWTQCKPSFVDFFDELAEYARNDQLSEKKIDNIRRNFDKMKEEAAKLDQCSQCFKHVELYFDQQIEMLEKMGFYQTESSKPLEIQNLHEEQISNMVGDALSSAVRVQILKALYDDGKSFTELSKITKLRAGNLLFHLDKLQDKGLIRQREERGEYQITFKGYHLLNSMLELVKTLGMDNEEEY
ncbi:Transcriptional regulator, ArsR family [Methanosarcina siciliae C2J]|uniref:Transcriptional regulator, ArsR family n=1 Tax=Methanosarcina siciliae C2J TaxID=1434118 RepID=A0A0E3PKN8_9EURY|nr:winged helix-turn-helix domain-containing protein [Methanosarcina siciliae]AKB34959.1 Transcriptional regulator, ArsR family [Methanosarcina siciliae C2J]